MYHARHPFQSHLKPPSAPPQGCTPHAGCLSTHATAIYILQIDNDKFEWLLREWMAAKLSIFWKPFNTYTQRSDWFDASYKQSYIADAERNTDQSSGTSYSVIQHDILFLIGCDDCSGPQIISHFVILRRKWALRSGSNNILASRPATLELCRERTKYVVVAVMQ